MMEVTEIFWLYWNLNCDSVLLRSSLRRKECYGRHTRSIEVGIIDTLHAIEVAGDGEVVRITERRLATQTKAADLIVRISLGRLEVDRVDVVDVLMGDACAEILNRDPRLKSVGRMDMERLVSLSCLHMGIMGVASEFTDDCKGLVRVKVRKDLERFTRRTHLEACLIRDISDLFDTGVGVL